MGSVHPCIQWILGWNSWGQTLTPDLRLVSRLARQAMYMYCKIQLCLCNHCCNRKLISITYSEHVFLDLGIQHAMRMHHIVICGPPCSMIFFHIISKQRFSEKNVTEHKPCVRFSLQILSEIFLILGRIEQDMIKNVYRSSCKVPSILVQF